MKPRDWREINSEYARVYTDFRGEFSPRTIRHILKTAALPRRAVVLDLATGAGAVLRQLTGRSRRVIGMDAALDMLRQAQTRPDQAGRRPPLACADGLRLPLPANSLDLVTIGQAIHWFDLPALFAELMRVLRPGGTLAVLSRYPSPAGWLGALVEQARYPVSEAGRSATPVWSSLSAPSNLLGLEQAGLTGYQRRVFAHTMTLPLEGYLQGQAERVTRLNLPGKEQEQYLHQLREVLLPHASDGWLRDIFFDYTFTAHKPVEG